MNFAEEFSILIDSLTYVEAYGPDEFPAEDGTDLAKESRRIIERFDAIAPLGHGSTRQHWLRLARQAIVAGFESFSTDADSGRRHFGEGIEFIRRAVRDAVPKSAFAVGTDGITYHARDIDPNGRYT